MKVYFKKIHDVVEYSDGADFIASPYIERDILQGSQTAYSFELMVEKEKGKLNGWILYTYSRSQILVDGVHEWDKINNGQVYPANYDRPHALNVIMNFRNNRRLSFSGNIVYNSGRPVTYPVYFRSEEGTVKGYKISVFGTTIVTLSWNFKFGSYASE